MLVTFDVSDF